jgi:hypothetical protein
MNAELSKQLCEKYPNIFVNRDSSVQESLMSFGFECGDGWYKVIDALCVALTYTYTTSIEVDEEDGKRLGIDPLTTTHPDTKEKETFYSFEVNPPQVVASQVKEKFGTLRFYIGYKLDPMLRDLKESGKYPEIDKVLKSYYDYYDGIIHMAEIMSSMTCEETGKEGELHVSNGGKNGWYKTLNREYAKTYEFYVSRDYVPLKDIPRQESDEIE